MIPTFSALNALNTTRETSGKQTSESQSATTEMKVEIPSVSANAENPSASSI